MGEEVKDYIQRLLCRLGFHHIESSEEQTESGVYYTWLRCRRCAHQRHLTEWDGWNP